MSDCPISQRKNYPMTDRLKTGEHTLRAVLGDAHIDRSQAKQTDFDAPLQALVTEGAWVQYGPMTPYQSVKGR